VAAASVTRAPMSVDVQVGGGTGHGRYVRDTCAHVSQRQLRARPCRSTSAAADALTAADAITEAARDLCGVASWPPDDFTLWGERVGGGAGRRGCVGDALVRLG